MNTVNKHDKNLRKVCPICFHQVENVHTVCPYCGWEFKKDVSDKELHDARISYWIREYKAGISPVKLRGTNRNWEIVRQELKNWLAGLPPNKDQLGEMRYIDTLPEGISLILEILEQFMPPEEISNIYKIDPELPAYFLASFLKGAQRLLDYMQKMKELVEKFVEEEGELKVFFEEKKIDLKKLEDAVDNILSEKDSVLYISAEILNKKEELRSRYEECKKLKKEIRKLNRIQRECDPESLKKLEEDLDELKGQYEETGKYCEELKEHVRRYKELIQKASKLKLQLEKENGDKLILLETLIKDLNEIVKMKIDSKKAKLRELTNELKEKAKEFEDLYSKLEDYMEEFDKKVKKNEELLEVLNKHFNANMKVATSLLRGSEESNVISTLDDVEIKLRELQDKLSKTDEMLRKVVKSYLSDEYSKI